MTRKPNLRRLLNSWSARALAVIAAVGTTAEFLPTVAEYLPRGVLGFVAGCALLSRAWTEAKR
jgi:hypothetical protein